MKILITGGSGHIGGSLGAALARRGDCHVVLVDNLSTGSKANLPSENENWTFIKADANHFEDVAAIMTAHRFDYVFHYAAVVGVKRTQENPVSVLKDLEGIRVVLDLAKNTGVKRVFFSSSSEVYGEPVGFPQHEHTTPLNSRLPYAVVKNVGESFCRSYQQEYALAYTIFRFFNTYGPFQSTDFVISKFIRAALRGEDVTIFGDGSQTRTFCYIDDNVAATLACLSHDETVNETLNIGHATEISILELARMVIAKTGSKSKIVHLSPLKAGDMTRRQPNNSKMIELLGRPLIDLGTGLDMLLEDEAFCKRLEASG